MNKRAIYAIVRRPWEPAKDSFPVDLSDPQWIRWNECDPQDIEDGTTAAMIAHKAFEQGGGVRLFDCYATNSLIFEVFTFDIERDKIVDGKIRSVHNYKIQVSKP